MRKKSLSEIQVLQKQLAELRRDKIALEESIQVAKADGLLYTYATLMDERKKIINQMQERIEFLERQIANLKHISRGR